MQFDRINNKFIHNLGSYFVSNNNPGEALKLNANQLKDLKHLHLEGPFITAKVIASFLNAAPNLENLTIYDCVKLGEGLLNLKPNQLNKLLTLDMRGSLITSKQLISLFSAAPNLETIDYSLGQSDDKNVHKLFYANQLSHLKKFIFPSALTIKQLEAILIAAPNLESINLAAFTQLGDTSLHLKSTQLLHLKKIYTRGSSITADQLAKIIGAAPNLETIDINNCEKLGDVLLNTDGHPLNKLAVSFKVCK